MTNKKKGREAVIYKDLMEVCRWFKAQEYTREEAEPYIRDEAEKYAPAAMIIYEVDTEEMKSIVGKVLKSY